MKKKLLFVALFVLIAALALAACGGGKATEAPAKATEAPAKATEAPAKATEAPKEQPTEAPAAEELTCDDPLGCVTIGPDDPIRIGYALVLSGPNESLGVDSRRGVEIAIHDRNGELLGHKIELVGEDSQCSAEGGQTAATKLASDQTLLGVIGTNCSSAGEPAAAILSDAGMVLISPSNTAPSLTAPETHQPGYLRTAHNDKVQGKAMATFAYNELGKRKAATIHDGSPYAEQLQQVFADNFAGFGGEVVAQEAVNVGDTDMRPVLTSIATHGPDFLYYPIFIAEGAFVTRQAKEVSGLENTTLAGADGMISPDFLDAAGDAAEGMYISGPNLNFENDLGKHFLEVHQELYGEPPISAFHAHAYDATNMLLNAIAKVAVKDKDGNLYIGRQALRDALYATKGMQGITGTITCDEYGDCADPQIVVNQIQKVDGKLEYVPVWDMKKGWLTGEKAGEGAMEGGGEMAEGEIPVVENPPEDPLGVVKIGPDDPIRIGYALVLSGPNESLGVDSRRGVEIAIHDRNGELLGHKIELVGEDSQCSAEGGQTAATKLASDQTLLGVIGTNCSSAGEPAAAILSDAGMVLISPSNTAPSLTAPETHQPGYLRTAHNDKVQGKAMATFAYNELGKRKAATIHDGSPYAEQLQQVFADNFAGFGGEVVAQEAVNVGDTDMRPVLTSIATHGPDFLYYPIFIAEGAFVTRQAKEVSGLENTTLAGADGMISPDFLDAAGDAAEGMYISGPNLNFENDLGKHFLEVHQELYGEPPISAFHAHAYDATNMLLNAIAKVAVKDKDGNLYIGRQALRDALYATKGMQGITGTITCDEYGDCADPQIVVNQIQKVDGKLEYVPVWDMNRGWLNK